MTKITSKLSTSASLILIRKERLWRQHVGVHAMQLQRWLLASGTMDWIRMFGAAALSFMPCLAATCLLKIQIQIDCTKRYWTVTIWSLASSRQAARTWSRKFWTPTPRLASLSKMSGRMSGSRRWSQMIWKVLLLAKTQFQLLTRLWSQWCGICVTQLRRLETTLSCLSQIQTSTIRHQSSYRTTSTTRWPRPTT